MRLVVIALVLLNVAYFFWQRQLVVVPETPAVAAATGKQLRLISELPKTAAPTPEAMKSDQAAPADHKDGEAEPLAVAKSGVPKQVTPPSSTTRQLPRACYSIGPFLLVNDVNNAAQIFDEVEGIATQQRATAERSQVGYWVYIPPLDSLQAARAVLRELQRSEIRDVLIISEGVKANAISAGVYNVESQALERRDAIRALGYNAAIDPLYRTQPQYWLDLELMKLQTIPQRLWQRVSRKFPNTTKAQRKCE